MILIEVTPAVDSVGSLRTFYFGTVGWQTSPTDSPANVAFDEAVMDAGSIGLHVFSDGRTGGATLLETGEIIIANLDGSYDDFAGYAFNGRQVVIRQGDGGPYPSAFSTIFTGVMDSVEATVDQLVIRLKDKAAMLDRPVLTTKYAGTNVGPTGLEGTDADIQGQVKPRGYGAQFYTSPPNVNTSLLIYQVSDGPIAAIDKVYDQGAELAFGANHATSTLLAAAPIADGEYDTCLAEGLFRLGASSISPPTCDFRAKANDYDMTAGQILARLATEAGLQSTEISAADIGELNAAAPFVLQLYLDDETTFRDAMDQVANSVGAWYAFDNDGVLRCGRLTPPDGSTNTVLLEGEVMEGFERRTGAVAPVYRVSVKHSRFYTTQTTEVALSVSDQRRAELAQEYRQVTVEDLSIKIQFTQANEMVVDTLLTSAADAETVATYLLALHKVQREQFDVPLHTSILEEYPLDLMSTANFTHSRFGLSGGRNFRILGRGLELGRETIVLSLWG